MSEAVNSTDSTRFLVRELMHFSIQAGFATRNEDFPIYNLKSNEFNLKAAKQLKQDIRDFLLKYYEMLSKKTVTEEEHREQLRSMAKTITKRYRRMLYRETFRLGVVQKVVNLFLKYLWSANLIAEPYHCPFDNIVKRKIRKYPKNKRLIAWTEMKSIRDYDQYVAAARQAAANEHLSIAQWEMKHWSRR